MNNNSHGNVNHTINEINEEPGWILKQMFVQPSKIRVLIPLQIGLWPLSSGVF